MGGRYFFLLYFLFRGRNAKSICFLYYAHFQHVINSKKQMLFGKANAFCNMKIIK